MVTKIETPGELLQHLETNEYSMRLSIFDIATLKGVVDQAIQELGPLADTVVGSNEASEVMIQGFWDHLYLLSGRLQEALNSFEPFDASALNES